jgi:hypothetical protein
VIRALDKDGNAVQDQTADADLRSATIAPDSAVARVQVWAVFTTGAGLGGVTEPVAAAVQEPDPTTPPSSTPSSTPSATSTPGATPTSGATPTPTPKP